MTAGKSKTVGLVLLVILLALLIPVGLHWTMREVHAAMGATRRAPRERTEELRRIATVRDAVLRMVMFAGDHNGDLPTRVEQLGEPAWHLDGTAQDWSVLEIVGPANIQGLANPGTVVILQEKAVDKNGKRVRGYADGHSMLTP